MKLSDEELGELKLEREEALSHCRVLTEKMKEIREVLSTVEKEHHKWRDIAERADRTIALATKVVVLPTYQGKKKITRKEAQPVSLETLTIDQLINVAKQLGVELDR